jgi:hypothetical protein
VPNSKLWVDISLLLLNIFLVTIFLLKYELQDESYGLEKFRLFFPFYPCMLQLSSFSFFTFFHSQIPNMAPWMSFMVHNISIHYSCASNGIFSKDLYPPEVNWCRNFTLTISTITFSCELCFAPELAHSKDIFELFI